MNLANNRIIRTIIVAILVIMMPLGAYAQDRADEENQKFDVPELLASLGIINDADYSADDTVTRSDFSVFAAKLMGQTESEVKRMNVYDVDRDYENAWAISFAVDNGIISLDASKKFYPLRNISEAEVIDAVISILGYAPRYSAMGHDMAAQRRILNEMGLSSLNIEYKNTDITIEKLCDVFEKILCVPMLELKTIRDDNGHKTFSYTNKYNVTPLERWHNVKKVSGVLCATAGGNINFNEGRSDNYYLKVDDTYYFVSDKDGDDYLGYYVDVYSKIDTREVVCVVPDTNVTESTYIEAEDIVSYKSGTLTYLSNDKRKTISVPASSDIVYNGVAVSSADREAAMNIKDGYIVINKFSEGNTKMTVLVTEYDVIKVGVKSDNGFVYDDIIGGKKLCLDESAINVKIKDSAGNSLTYDDIAEGDILVASVSKNGDRARVIRCENTISGILKSVVNKEDNLFIKIDDTEYKVYYKYNDKAKSFKIGASVICYIDNSNRVASIKYSDDSDFKYGFLKDATKIANGFDENLAVKIFDGKSVGIYNCKEKFKVDEHKVLSADDAITCLKKGLLTDIDSIYQPIRFKLDSDNYVTYIDTAYKNKDEGESDDSLRYIYRGNNPYNLGTGSSLRLEVTSVLNFGQKFFSYSAKELYTIPTDKNSEDEFFRKGISLWARGSFLVDALTAKENSMIADLVISYKSANNTVTETGYAFIKDVCQVLKDDGDISYNINYIDDEGKEQKLNTAETVDEIDRAFTRKFKKGDFVSIGKTGKDEIGEITLLFDSETKQWLPSEDELGYFGNHVITHGYVMQINDGIFKLSTVKPVSESEYETIQGKYYNTASSKMYLVDSQRNQVREASAADMIAYGHSAEDCSAVVCAGYNGYDRIVAIYR